MTREEAIAYGKRVIDIGLNDETQAFCELAIQALSQEPCEDEYIKVPKRALKYRTAGMVAYNAEWLKDNFDIERAVICGAQQPCDDAVSRQAILDGIEELKKSPWATDKRGNGFEYLVTEALDVVKDLCVKQVPFVNPQPCEDAISREAVLDAVSEGCQELRGVYGRCEELINELPSVTQKSGKCQDCKYFEYDSVAKVDGIPLIVAHEICNKWGDGCKTKEDGYCFLYEPQESEEISEHNMKIG